jgi:hypothetical protein
MTARLMTVDELGNVYVVRSDNSLVRFTENGDSSAFFRSVQYGDIGGVDASNPLRVVVNYPSYSKVILLDRMLAQKNELNLQKLNIPNAVAVAVAADGNLWVYDVFNARLLKVDDQLTKVMQSNDLRQETGLVPNPAFMLEREQRVYLSDTTRGVMVFDRYGSYINTLPFFQQKYLQVYGSQIIYRGRDTLYSYNLNTIATKSIPIPQTPAPVINAAINRTTLYVLYGDRLMLYKIEEEK